MSRGGFYPSLMGPFVANVEAAIVPAALYTGYHMFVPKNKSKEKRNMTKKQTGSGVLADQQWFDPAFVNPTANNHHSSFSTSQEIRPVLVSTFKSAGGKRKNVSRKGGKNLNTSRKNASRKGVKNLNASRKNASRKGRKASRKGRKASRKNAVASRKNAVVSRKGRKASRKGRKASRKASRNMSSRRNNNWFTF